MNGWWGGHMDGWDGTGANGMGVGGMVLAGLLLVALVGTVVWLLLRRPRLPQGGPDVFRGSGAREMLDERFARGEIDEAEYRWRLGVLAERP